MDATPVSSADGPEITVHYPMGRERTLAYHGAMTAWLTEMLGNLQEVQRKLEEPLRPYRETVYVVEHPGGPVRYRLLAEEPWCPPEVREAQAEAYERIAGWRWRSP